MRNKSADHSLEWVVVSKRRIYAGIILLALAVVTLASGSYLWLYGSPVKSHREESRVAHEARFDTFDGEVRVVRALTRETVVVDAGTRVYPSDIVQTRATGRASITLADGSILTIRPNSVITIAENIGSDTEKYSHVRVAVERGGVKVVTDRQTPETSNIVETTLTKSKLSTKTVASFDVHEDNSEEIRVSAGNVEASTGGKRTTIRSGEYLAFNPAGEMDKREPLLDAPVPYAPSHLERIETRSDELATVALQWTHPMRATAHFYRVEIASSPFFVKAGIIFEREHLIAPKLIVTELKAGNYFWRVRSVSATGQTSEWCEPQKFAIVSSKSLNKVEHIQ